MQIHELAQHTGVAATAIRYYEAIGLLPAPTRQPNGYRTYHGHAVARVRFVASARRMGFALADIAAIVDAQDQGVAPCARVLATMDRRLAEVDRQLADLHTLRETLTTVRTAGAALPHDDTRMEHCVCALLAASSGHDATSRDGAPATDG